MLISVLRTSGSRKQSPRSRILLHFHQFPIVHQDVLFNVNDVSAARLLTTYWNTRDIPYPKTNDPYLTN